MLFELRNSVPEVSPNWKAARDHFLAGRSSEAWNLSQSQRGRNQQGRDAIHTANDFLLNIEIARACSANRTYLGLVKLGVKAHPDDPFLQLYQARMLLTRGLHMQGIEYLQSLEETLPKTHRVEWISELANVYGSAGFEGSCRNWLAKIDDSAAEQSALALYTIAGAQTGMQQWSEAIDYARRCLNAAPQWSRARSNLVNCLLTQGQVDEAQEILRVGQELGHEDSTLDVCAAMLSFSLGDFAVAEARFRALLDNWPQADFRRWVQRTLCVLLVELDRGEEAAELAAGEEERLALPSLKDCPSDQPHRFIPVPLVAQSKNQCVPTSIAMAAYPQGRLLDAPTLFAEMKGRDGTALWRMRDWLRSHGFRLVPVRLEEGVITKLLDAEIPLMGVLELPFNSHVELICGYNRAINVFYVRDPMHWAPSAIPVEMVFQRYEAYDSVLAIIDERSEATIELAKVHQNCECEALLDLAEASANGARENAERAYAKIADDSPAAFLRDGFANCIAISPDTFGERMQHYAKSDSVNSISRFRALMTLGSNEAHAILEKFVEEEELQLGPSGERYLRLMQLMHNGEWKAARKLVEQLLLFGSSVSSFWDLKSEILAELGDQKGCRAALDLAIQLDPHRLYLREKLLNRTANELTYAEYLQEFQSLLETDSDDKSLLWGKAIALYDGPDGKAFEQAAREYMHWYPRDPRAYSTLIQWYRHQARAELADELAAAGNALLDNMFPLTETINQELVETSGKVASQENSPQADDPLPEDKEQLLSLYGQGVQPRRAEILERLLQLEKEGALLWYERASLLAARLTIGLSPGSTEKQIQKLLPTSTPGAAHWFASHVTELVDQNNPTLKVAQSVVDWIEQVVPEFRNYTEIWFNRIVLMEKAQQIERALTELEELIKQYPAHSSALYRMGVVRHEQGKFQESIDHFERALKINPGLYGAMYMVRAVHDTLANADAWRQATTQLRQKFPYDFGFFQEEVNFALQHESDEAAEKLIADNASYFCGKRIQVMKAQLNIDRQRYEEAEKLLSSVEITEESGDDLYEDSLKANLNLASHTRSEEKILELCDQGLRRWPDSTRLKELKAEYLNDHSASLYLLEEVLCEGEPTAQTALQFLATANASPVKAARHSIEKAAADRRQSLTELFAEAMEDHSLLQHGGAFLNWAVKKFPDSDNLLYRQAIHYNVHGKAKAAIKAARTLYERNPEHPEAARILGRCLIDHKAKKALPYLEKACQKNRSTDNLFDLARAHHVAGKRDRAKQLHWEVLELNPYMSASLVSLYILKAEPTRLWPYINPMLELGCGRDDEYFVVATVKIAKSVRETTSPAWINVADQRWSLLQTRPGFQDEKPQLKRAIAAWLTVRPDDGQNREHLPSNLLTKLHAKLFWPRCEWVPVP